MPAVPPRLAVLAAAALAGCSKPPPAPPAPVRGTVTFQARPLAGGLVVFTPDRERGPAGPPVAARLDADGHYELKPAPPAAPGAPPGVSQGVTPGWYVVALSDSPQSTLGPFPAELKRPDRAGIAREVVAGRDNVIDFAVSATE